MGCRIDKHSRKQEQKRIRRFKNLKKPWYSPEKKYQECSVYRWEEQRGLGDTVWGDQIPNLQNNGGSTWELNLAGHKVQADIKSLLARLHLHWQQCSLETPVQRHQRSVSSRGQSKPLVMLVLLSRPSHVPVGHSTLWPLVKPQAGKWTVSSYRQALRISSELKGGKERLAPRSVSLRSGLGLSLTSTPENWSTRKLTPVSYCTVHIQSLQLKSTLPSLPHAMPSWVNRMALLALEDSDVMLALNQS